MMGSELCRIYALAVFKVLECKTGKDNETWLAEQKNIIVGCEDSLDTNAYIATQKYSKRSQAESDGHGNAEGRA